MYSYFWCERNPVWSRCCEGGWGVEMHTVAFHELFRTTGTVRRASCRVNRFSFFLVTASCQDHMLQFPAGCTAVV